MNKQKHTTMENYKERIGRLDELQTSAALIILIEQIESLTKVCEYQKTKEDAKHIIAYLNGKSVAYNEIISLINALI